MIPALKMTKSNGCLECIRIMNSRAIAGWPSRRMRRAVARGQVVVFDRYALDSRVHLRARYGEEHVARQVRLLGRLVPEPLAAFYLDVAPEVAVPRSW